jgi:hypothetical protein
VTTPRFDGSTQPGSTRRVLSVLSAGLRIETSAPAERPDAELWLTTAELERATGWRLKAEGLCQGEVCVPLDSTARRWIEGDQLCASEIWRALARPVLADAAHSSWFLGEAAEDRARTLSSLEAPDFTLPDIEGKLHSLSEFRGKKVLLATWASW